MPYYPNNGQWYNWTANIVHNLTNTTDPVKTLVTNSVGTALPWFWPAVPFLLYLLLFLWFNEAPSRYKFVFITLIVMVISMAMAASQLISDAVINIVIFGFTLVVSNLTKS